MDCGSALFLSRYETGRSLLGRRTGRTSGKNTYSAEVSIQGSRVRLGRDTVLRIHRTSRAATRAPEEERMCPACMATLALFAAGVSAGGGLATLAMKKLRQTIGAKDNNATSQTSRGQDATSVSHVTS